MLHQRGRINLLIWVFLIKLLDLMCYCEQAGSDSDKVLVSLTES